MKKKKLKNLSLNKVNISKIDNVNNIKGGDTMLACTIISLTSFFVCSIADGSCDCDPDPIVADPDNTRGCPSWNVAC
ncbi:hypothetical protein [Kordia jejudonensis]|uniref:hypothetical protein n=1 Tax=Kordia jejudonensis TaxID=1348245 RepID=UPI000629B734|nr:hypothetical protein [Kordia jejudonensis]